MGKCFNLDKSEDMEQFEASAADDLNTFMPQVEWLHHSIVQGAPLTVERYAKATSQNGLEVFPLLPNYAEEANSGAWVDYLNRAATEQ